VIDDMIILDSKHEFARTDDSYAGAGMGYGAGGAAVDYTQGPPVDSGGAGLGTDQPMDDTVADDSMVQAVEDGENESSAEDSPAEETEKKEKTGENKKKEEGTREEDKKDEGENKGKDKKEEIPF